MVKIVKVETMVENLVKNLYIILIWKNFRTLGKKNVQEDDEDDLNDSEEK